MLPTSRPINPHLSVDCVVFGFSGNRLKVLLIRRDYTNENGIRSCDHKLPGDFITTAEDLDMAATRTLEELTGLREIFLRQFAVFGRPDRISRRIDREWLLETTGMDIQRVVTTAYFALLNISRSRKEFAIKNNASWIDVNRIPPLAFDHAAIVEQGLRHLQNSLRNEPIGFEMLPERFTIRDLQNLYEVILGCELDNRNFRKKVLKAGHLVQLDLKQEGVAHKPAYYYRFDKAVYERSKRDSLGFIF
jgi:ADP-ribose pyrophosphatase YjhB (NUDIX family)